MARKAVVVLVGMFFSSSEWLVAYSTMAVLSLFLVLHVVLRPYADHELDHGDEDSHDKSLWTDPDKLDGISLVCSIVCLVCGMYYLILGENPEKTGAYYTISFAAVIIACIPLVLSIKYAWDGHVKQKQASANKSKSHEDDKATKVENPVVSE